LKNVVFFISEIKISCSVSIQVMGESQTEEQVCILSAFKVVTISKKDDKLN